MIISETSLQNSLHAVIPTRGKNYKFPMIMTHYKRPIAAMTNIWDHQSFMFTDFLANIIRNKECINMIPKANESFEIKKKITDDDFNSINESHKINSDDIYTVYFNDTEFRAYVYNYWKCSHIQVKQLLERISSCQLRLDAYICRVFKANGYYHLEKYSNLNGKSDYQSLFSFEEVDTIFDNTSRHNSSYKLSFDTPLGLFFVHNIIAGNVCLMSDEIYNLSKHAQLIYRLLVRLKKSPVKINLTDVFEKLNLPNCINSRKIIYTSLEELQKNGFIKSHTFDSSRACSLLKFDVIH